MRVMMKVSMSVEAGNRAAKANKLGSTIQAILAEQKPEAVYFCAENGQRTAFLFLQMRDSAEIPKLAEPWFLAFNAHVTVRPAMNPQDLAAAGPGFERAIKEFGK